MSENSKISFSKGVKEELLSQVSLARHCRIAEIAAITAFCGIKKAGEDKFILGSDSPDITKKYFTLLGKTIKISECTKGTIRGEEITRICELLKQSGESEFAPVDDILLQRECCRKAYLRGAFLAAGSVSDPNKSYHLEIVSDKEALSVQVLRSLESLGVPAKITERKKSFVVYLKEGALLVETLGIMGAPLGLMEFENARIVKDIRNDLNRKVNCEAANIKKTISAAMSQIEDINYIESKVGLSELPQSLKEVASLRREYPEASLTELGQMLIPAVGKSGINHRLRRISQFADEVRKEESK